MANASAKKQASVNQAQLANLRNISAAIYGATFLFFWVAKRPIFSQLLFCIPGFVAQYVLSSWCSPKFDRKNQLVRAGISINQEGLVDYVKDIIILTWVCVLSSVVLGQKAWLILLSAPAFAIYKAWNILKMGRTMLNGGQSAAAAGSTSTDQRLAKDQPARASAKQTARKRTV